MHTQAQHHSRTAMWMYHLMTQHRQPAAFLEPQRKHKTTRTKVTLRCEDINARKLNY